MSESFLSKIDEDISLVLDNLPVGIMRISNDGQCLYANQYILNLLQVMTISDVYEKYMSSIHCDDFEKERNLCKEFFHDLKESTNVIRVLSVLNKMYHWYMIKRKVIRSSDGSISFMHSILDVHDNKEMEMKLRDETLKAEKAYNHKTIFLANMSHEIRTPLNGIIGMLTLLEDTSLNNDQQDYLSMIKECSYNLMTIINDILDFSKLEVGKISLDSKSMNLRECVESTNDIVMSKIYEKSLEYICNIDNNVPIFIQSDQNRIKQILLNLLSNAIKFTDKGTIILNVKRISNEDLPIQSNSIIQTIANTGIVDECFLRFDISDTGCGIDPQDKGKLFKSFSQIDNRLTSKIYQGTGLGLAISKELVELLNGHIWLDYSEPYKGSMFSFVIRTHLANDDTIFSDDTNAVCLQNLNVLIVDDNIHNRLSLSGIVSKWGMKPYSYSNAEEALYFSRLHHFDIGLIDICMPKVDGHTFSAKLKEQCEFNNKKMPLIALSSLGDKVSILNKNFSAHLVKPVKEMKLKRVCVNLLSNHIKECPIPEINNSYIKDLNYLDLKCNIRILIAEDIYINQRVIVSFLNKSGFTNAFVVENGQQCLDLVLEKNFDIILLDIRMPVMNGEMVIEKINNHYKKGKRTSRKPYIVAVTAYGMKEDKDKYLNMGFDDYIAKPISKYQLDKCMNHFLETLLKE
jgi:two-component system sensor histidine kinase/response regulator